MDSNKRLDVAQRINRAIHEEAKKENLTDEDIRVVLEILHSVNFQPFRG
ncbi:hypothetical protein CBJ89_001974 [Salmonella enterica subsp. enterica serovar Essen]|nr:hypothetical protein [Salmonella enterica subsp. enterica serovar Essen]